MLKRLWTETLRDESSTSKDYERVAEAVVEMHKSSDGQFREHIQNRFGRVTKATGQPLDANNFDIAMARALVADEVGFASWDELIGAVNDPAKRRYPLLFEYAIAALWRGDFTALENRIGGPDAFDETVIDWFEKGYFEREPETLAEIFSAACMLGHPRSAEYLLDKGVNPYAGMRTGLAGFHYAASSGRLEVVKLLTARKIPMEVENMYGGTVLGQALWSAINEHTPQHAEIADVLIRGGAHVWPNTLDWWLEQDVPDAKTKERIANTLRAHAAFIARVKEAREAVSRAESEGVKRPIADALKNLGNILRRPPFGRDEANRVYSRAASLYTELGLPLEEAWVKRHIGINHEYAGHLDEAEKYYDEALALYREHSTEDDGNYANAVRYPAVIKEQLGKKDEAARLWEEAHDRYAKIHPAGLGEGVAEAAAWLTILALEKGDLGLAEKWFDRASDASSNSSDPDTHKFIADVAQRLDKAKNS